MKQVLIFLSVFIRLTASTQVRLASFPVIIKRVQTIQANDAAILSRKLTAGLKSDLEKTWALFNWVTNNIAYDVAAYKGLWDSALLVGEDPYFVFNELIANKVLKEQ